MHQSGVEPDGVLPIASGAIDFSLRRGKMRDKPGQREPGHKRPFTRKEPYRMQVQIHSGKLTVLHRSDRIVQRGILDCAVVGVVSVEILEIVVAMGI